MAEQMKEEKVTLENYQKLAERTSATATHEGTQTVALRMLENKPDLEVLFGEIISLCAKVDRGKRHWYYGKGELGDLRRSAEPIELSGISHTHVRLIHAAFGLITEGGELLAAVINSADKMQTPDPVNAGEEIGDAAWYMAEAANAIQFDLQSILQANIDKLRKRFAEKFTTDEAITRDLDAERNSLESSLPGSDYTVLETGVD